MSPETRRGRPRPGTAPTRIAPSPQDNDTPTVSHPGRRWVRVEIDRDPRGMWSVVAWKLADGAR